MSAVFSNSVFNFLSLLNKLTMKLAQDKPSEAAEKTQEFPNVDNTEDLSHKPKRESEKTEATCASDGEEQASVSELFYGELLLTC